MTSIEVNARSAVPALPGQHSQLPGKREDGDPQAQAWRREMERAQIETWLSHGVVGCHSSASSAEMSSPMSKAAASQPVSLPTGANTGFAASSTRTSAVATSPNVSVAGQLHPARRVASSGATSVAGSESHSQLSTVLTEANPTANRITTAPSDFNAATLTQTLRRFGVIEATTASRPLVPFSPPLPLVAAEKLNGALPPALVVAPAQAQAAHQPAAPPLLSDQPADLSLQLRARAQQAPAAPDRGVKAPLALAANARAESIRVHAEWSDDGVRLWLGVDASVLRSLDQITHQLQTWVTGQGLRLRALSCNGQVLSEEPASEDRADFTHASGEFAGSPPVHSKSKEFP